MARYDFPIPYGWFYIAESTDVEVGAIKTIRSFGRDLVAWRGEDGVVHVQDAYCPHLGAHLGVGGAVVGNTIECPFHKWRFNGDGSVAAIPYAEKINPYACLPAYPSLERFGAIMAWYHPEGTAPSFDLPAVPELESGEYKGPTVTPHLIKTCLQEMGENTVDGAHFQTIHQHPGAASYDGFVFEGPLMSMASQQLFPSSRGPVEGTLNSETWGFGFSVVRYNTVIEICMIATNAAIEQDLSMQVNRVYWKNPTNDPQIDKIAAAFSKEVNRQLQQDVPIWENKIYRDKPYLCDGDGPFVKFRRWAKQFYVEPTEKGSGSEAKQTVDA